MMKLLGAILMIGSASALGLSARQRLVRRIEAIDAMLQALAVMEAELSCHLASWPEIIGRLASQKDNRIRKVFAAMQARIEKDDGLSMPYKWCRCLCEQGEAIGLRSAEIRILCDLSSFLGTYELQQQMKNLTYARVQLEALRRNAAEELKSKGNIYRTCGIALGLLLVLLLV